MGLWHVASRLRGCKRLGFAIPFGLRADKIENRHCARLNKQTSSAAEFRSGTWNPEFYEYDKHGSGTMEIRRNYDVPQWNAEYSGTMLEICA